MYHTDAKHLSIMRYVLTALVLFGLVQTYAFGSFITYTDRAAFLAAASGASLTTTNEDFSVDPGDPFTITDGTNSVTLDITSGSHMVDKLWNSNTAIGVRTTSTSVVGSVAGIGFDFELGSPFAPHTYLLINSTVMADSYSQSGFVGLLSTDGMLVSSVDDLITYDGWGAGFEAIVDNVVIATETTTPPDPIPEPNTLLLFAIGFVGILGLVYLKRRGKKASA